MNVVLFFKRYRGYGVYQYAKLWPDRLPPLAELLNFHYSVPRIEHREYDLENPTDQLDFRSLLDEWEWIDEAEFVRAYKRATVSEFELYVDGKLI